MPEMRTHLIIGAFLCACLLITRVNARAQMVMMGSFMEPRMNPDDPTPAEVLMVSMSPQQREMFRHNEETRKKYMSIMKSGQRDRARQLTAQEMFLKYEYEQSSLNLGGEPVIRGNRQLFPSDGVPESKQYISVPKYKSKMSPVLSSRKPFQGKSVSETPLAEPAPESQNQAQLIKPQVKLNTETNMSIQKDQKRLHQLEFQKGGQEHEPKAIPNQPSLESKNRDQSPLAIFYRDPSQDSTSDSELVSNQGGTQDQGGQESITIDLITSQVTTNINPIEEVENVGHIPQTQGENKEESEVYYKDAEGEEEPVYYYKDFPQSSSGSVEAKDFKNSLGPNSNQASLDSNSQFVITTKSAGEVKLSDQLLAEDPNNILKNLDLSPPDPFVFQPVDLTGPNKKIKKVRKIRVDKNGNRIEVDPNTPQKTNLNGNLVESLTSDNQLNVFEFEFQGNEDDTGVIQTIEIEGPVDYEFNYVVDLINSGFFTQEEAQALGGNTEGNFQVQDGGKTQEVDYNVSPESGFVADTFWELNSK
eukprot:TCALIF_07310-PA protein Name:"Protein of unknown function" AED:0.54 eAED:0.54 QI:0/0/0/0.5/0/0/2/0/530